jgi:hypothetical protein
MVKLELMVQPLASVTITDGFPAGSAVAVEVF